MVVFEVGVQGRKPNTRNRTAELGWISYLRMDAFSTQTSGENVSQTSDPILWPVSSSHQTYISTHLHPA